MRYLKYFESIETLREEFIELTNNYLAFLIDDGLILKTWQTKPDFDEPYITVTIEPRMLWEDCKDTIIPYLEVIKSKYDLVPDNFLNNNKELTITSKSYIKNDNTFNVENLNIDELLSGEIEFDSYHIFRINFIIKKK